MKTPEWTIYCHTHIESGRCYIGLTKKTMMFRWNRHVYDAVNTRSGNTHFANAIRKYGKDAFSHEVLATCASPEEANRIEQDKIKEFDTTNPEKGFNLAKGGTNPPYPNKVRKNPWDDPNYRARKTASNREVLTRPEVLLKLSRANAGKSRSPEVCAKISKVRKGKHLSSETRAKISRSSRERFSDPVVRKRISKKSKLNWKNLEYIARFKKSNKSSDPEVRSRISISVARHYRT